MKIGFDNEKYLKMQSEHIRDRINQFDNKLYLNRYKKNLPKRREAGTWLKPRRYEKEIYLLERLALETCFQKCFAVSGLFIEKQWRLFFTSFVVDKISIRENCDQNVYTG